MICWESYSPFHTTISIHCLHVGGSRKGMASNNLHPIPQTSVHPVLQHHIRALSSSRWHTVIPHLPTCCRRVLPPSQSPGSATCFHTCLSPPHHFPKLSASETHCVLSISCHFHLLFIKGRKKNKLNPVAA